MYFMEKLNRKRSEHFNDEKTAFLKNLFTFCGNEGTTYLESVTCTPVDETAPVLPSSQPRLCTLWDVMKRRQSKHLNTDQILLDSVLVFHTAVTGHEYEPICGSFLVESAHVVYLWVEGVTPRFV